ncbi:MAG: hypothetical protein ACRCUS_08835 [Anaerovoracaceae bacterium]
MSINKPREEMEAIFSPEWKEDKPAKASEVQEKESSLVEKEKITPTLEDKDVKQEGEKRVILEEGNLVTVKTSSDEKKFINDFKTEKKLSKSDYIAGAEAWKRYYENKGDKLSIQNVSNIVSQNSIKDMNSLLALYSLAETISDGAY